MQSYNIIDTIFLVLGLRIYKYNLNISHLYKYLDVIRIIKYTLI